MPITRRKFLSQSAAAVSVSLAASGCVTHDLNADDLIIDVHLHLWDLDRQKLGWLEGSPAILRKSYRLQDYRKATSGLNVRAVYMEVDIVPEALNEEAAFALGLSGNSDGLVLGAVIGGRPAQPGFGDYIRSYKSNRRFKGVRQVLHGPNTPAGYCLQPDFIRGVRQLGEIGRSFDLCMRGGELMDGAKLASECRGTRFILDHCGNPDLKCFRKRREGEPEPTHSADVWRRSIDSLAKLPNVICKISGVAASLPVGGGTEDLAPAVNHCLDAFGPDRVVFGGDWPVCLLGATYQRWVGMLGEIISTRPKSQQRQLWSGNALREYGLPLRG